MVYERESRFARGKWFKHFLKKEAAISIFFLVGSGVLMLGCGGLPEDAAVTVNGVVITKDAVETRIDYRNKVFPGMVSREDEANFPKIRRQTTKDLVLAEIERQEAERRGISVSAAEVSDELQMMAEDDFLGDLPRMMEDFASKEITDAELRESTTERLNHEKLIASVKEEISVSDEEIQKYYKSNQAQYDQPELRQTRQIVTASQAAALDAIGQVDAGESFVDVAKKHSTDSQAPINGGSLGLVAPGKLSPDLSAALFTMNIGQVSDPINVDDKWYVLTVEAIQPARAMSIDEAREEISQIIAEESMAARWKSLLDGFYSDASLEYDPDYDPALT